jgi:hypothetical protein
MPSLGTVPVLVSDEPFEFHWVSDGGAAKVTVSISGPVGLGPGSSVSFSAEAGCGKPHAVRVSQLPAGYSYTLWLTFEDLPGDPNPGVYPCPDLQHVWVLGLSWSPFDFSGLPISSTPLREVTLTLLTP